MTSNITPATRHTYFALDSDVLTNLAELDQIKRKNPDAKAVNQIRELLDKDRHNALNRNLNFYNEILNLAKSGEIRFLITPTVFYECKHIPWVFNFMKKKCYVPKLSISNYKHQEYLVRELAKAYCSEYYTEEVDENGETVKLRHRAPLSTEYNAHFGDLVPSNDAYIMAEATVFNAILLTENGRHLCFREEKYTQDNIDQFSKKNEYVEETVENSRSKGIVDINIQMGYCQDQIKDDEVIGRLVSMPYTIETIGPILKYFKKSVRFPHSNDNVFAKLKDELGSINPRV